MKVHAVHVDALRIVRIDPNLTEVHRSWIEAVHLGPAFAFILRAEHAAFAMLHGCDKNVRIPPIDIDAYAADVAGGQSPSELAPRATAVNGLV
jgi:hypothetical protein